MSLTTVEVEQMKKESIPCKEDFDDVDGPRVANGESGIDIDVDDDLSSKPEQTGSDSEPEYSEKVKQSTPFNPFSNKLFNINDNSFDLDIRHKYAIGRNDSLSPETSKLLKDILQNRERRVQMQMRMSAAKSPLGFPNGSDALMAKLYQRDPAVFHNSDLDMEMSMLQSMARQRTEGSSDESDDQDIDKNQNKRSTLNSECSSPGIGSGQLSPSEGFDGDPESKLLKRARVENIITNMQMSPNPKADSAPTPPLDGSRRQKRKQCQPMQHEGARIDEPVPNKVRKLEHDDLRQQLSIMQMQLMEMQQKYHSLFEKERGELLEAENGIPVKTQEKILKQDTDAKSKDEKKPEKKKPWLNFGFDTDEAEPSHVIDNVRKLVKEQEISTRSGNIDANNVNLNQLAKLLKAEIRDAISQTVDSVVVQFLNQHNKTKHSSNIAMTESAAKAHASSQQDKPKIEHPKPSKPKVTDRHAFRPPEMMHNGFAEALHQLHPHHTFPPLSFFPQAFQPPLPSYKKEPEQTEALALVVNTPKKKRTKVTDTRLSPRAARALLHEPSISDSEKHPLMMPPPPHHDLYPPLVPVSLPTSVAIPNPSLQHSDVLSMYSHSEHNGNFNDPSHSPPVGDHMSPSGAQMPMDNFQLSMVRPSEPSEAFDRSRSETPTYEASMQHMTSTLTPMHLRKAKLMFFYVRYPSSAILKVFFPDIKFNKNNTAQLVKWFSNFREFYYIQMEKYARQAIAEGVKNPEDLVVTTDAELYRVLNLHYNRNNQIEVPDSFRNVVEGTLREFFKSVIAGKDQEQSWKKAIYKVIARMDDPLPEFFKSPNWMEQLGEQ